MSVEIISTTALNYTGIDRYTSAEFDVLFILNSA